jgi:uncharacterized protein (DUF983 family)
VSNLKTHKNLLTLLTLLTLNFPLLFKKPTYRASKTFVFYHFYNLTLTQSKKTKVWPIVAKRLDFSHFYNLTFIQSKKTKVWPISISKRLPNHPLFANVQAMRLKAILHARCPHCLQGKIFSSFMKMYETCPVCGIEYEREHGFFMMSIFIGYILGFIAAIPALIILLLLDAPIYAYFVVPAIILFPLAPLIFRYSRVIWLHLDELMDPRPITPPQ